jgi:ubiquinone/menaquinone biosynthesis C-methylase UbiE
MSKPGYLRLMRMALGFRESKILLVANDKDIFSELAAGLNTVDALAAKLIVNARALRIMLDALTAMGVLSKKGQYYFNEDATQHYLVRGKPEYKGDFLKFLHMCWNQWNDLDQALEVGTANENNRVINNTQLEFNHAYLQGMDNMGWETAEKIAPLLDLNSVHSMLDVGGGAATFSIAFAKKNPDMKSLVIDFPPALEVAHANIEHNKMGDRIKTMAGNFWDVDFGCNHDLVWISRVVHHLDETECAKMITKAVSALSPGGRVIVNDTLMDDNRVMPHFAAMFSVFMLVITKNGRCYTINEAKEWMKDAGLIDVNYIEIDEECRMVIGRKPRS